jgi:hypothetical protein
MTAAGAGDRGLDGGRVVELAGDHGLSGRPTCGGVWVRVEPGLGEGDLADRPRENGELRQVSRGSAPEGYPFGVVTLTVAEAVAGAAVAFPG